MKKKSFARVVSVIFYILAAIVAVAGGAFAAYVKFGTKAKTFSTANFKPVYNILKKLPLYTMKNKNINGDKNVWLQFVIYVAAVAVVLLLIAIIFGLIARAKKKKAMKAEAAAAALEAVAEVAPVEEVAEEAVAAEEAVEEAVAEGKLAALLAKAKEKVPSKEDVVGAVKKNIKGIAIGAGSLIAVFYIAKDCKRKKRDRILKWINSNMK